MREALHEPRSALLLHARSLELDLLLRLFCRLGVGSGHIVRFLGSFLYRLARLLDLQCPTVRALRSVVRACYRCVSVLTCDLGRVMQHHNECGFGAAMSTTALELSFALVLDQRDRRRTCEAGSLRANWRRAILAHQRAMFGHVDAIDAGRSEYPLGKLVLAVTLRAGSGKTPH